MDYAEATRNRLRRIEGQIRGVLGMMEADRDCRDVVTQLTAVRAALDKAIATIVIDNLETCIRLDVEQNKDTSASVREAMKLILQSR